MSIELGEGLARDARIVPFRQVIPRLLKDPVRALLDMGREADGKIIRMNLGPFRPYLVTHPDHLQHILRGNSANYTRDGVFWRPLRRLFGDGIMSDGPSWELSRRTLQPVFTAKHVESLADLMAEAIVEGVDELAGPVASGRPIDVPAAMARIVNRTVMRVFFGDKIDIADAERLAPAFDTVGTSVIFRYLLPSVPESVPVPGDRAFRRAVRTIDEIVTPLVQRHRGRTSEGYDIFSVLCRARDDTGAEPSPAWVRDNLVAMLATATETTAGALTWFWLILEAHPDVAARLVGEITGVVGDERVRHSHLKDLPYTGQVVQELLRLYPVGWLFPRMIVEREALGGVWLERGETVIVSPYVTHRLESFWDRPDEFDPDRFSRQRSQNRHRYAYFPFGGGPHQCIGMHVFMIETRLVIAGILSRYRPVSNGRAIAPPKMGASLRPSRRVELTLRPLSHA